MIEAIEVVEAVEVIEAAEVLRSVKLLLRTSESSLSLNELRHGLKGRVDWCPARAAAAVSAADFTFSLSLIATILKEKKMFSKCVLNWV